MKISLFALSVSAMLGLSSCVTNPSMTQSTVVGGGVGAGAGAIIGKQLGNTGAGLAIGATAGALIGNKRAYSEQQRELEYLRKLNKGSHAY